MKNCLTATTATTTTAGAEAAATATTITALTVKYLIIHAVKYHNIQQESLELKLAIGACFPILYIHVHVCNYIFWRRKSCSVNDICETFDTNSYC